MTKFVLIAVLLLLTAGSVLCECGDGETRIVLQFGKPYQAYQAVCMLDHPGPLQVVITRGNAVVRRFAVKTITEPMDLRAVRLRARRGPDIQAIFVQCTGGSASNDYVFRITPYGAKKLMYDFDRWGLDFGYDSRGRLRGMRFHYWRWHVDAQPPLRDHVYSAVDYTWLPERERFRKGGVHPDYEAEAKASLVDILGDVTGDYIYPVSYRSNADYERTVYYYQPIGLLKSKTPVALRNARKVKVEIQYQRHGQELIKRIASIGPAS